MAEDGWAEGILRQRARVMDLRQLEYFLRVEECGSFTAAAEALHVAQPSLSRQIRLLEIELRHRLFIRHGRGVIATEAGKMLAEQARLILRQVEVARESLDRMHPGSSGHLTIGMPSSLVKLVAAPLLAEFRRHLPNVSVSISDGLSISMQEWLLSGRLDIALLYKPLPSPDIHSIPILEEELFLFSRVARKSVSTPISLTEVAELPLILPKSPHEIRLLVDTSMAVLGCKPKVAVEVDSIPAILHLLRPGEQFAILPKYAVSIYDKPEAYVSRRIVNPSLSSKLVLAVATKRKSNVLYDEALKLMTEICGSVLRPIREMERMDFPPRASHR
jgi:LysR family transcriptional regulator, nitrogen assimilation regulatory protein